MEIQPKTNKVYTHCDAVYRAFKEDERYKVLIEQGGTRSGKTYNILNWLIFGYCLNHTGKTVSVVRKTMPALKGTARRDFFEILQNFGLYSQQFENKTENTYYINGNMVEFFSVADQQRVRGRKRDVLFCNEINELNYADFYQLIFRTNEIVIGDYNPSDLFHWVYDRVVSREDCAFFKTTYRDNPFLPSTLIAEIERLRDVDDTLWQIYGLGNKAQNKAVIFPNVNQVQNIPSGAKLVSYGMDFGYSIDPTALIAVYRLDDQLYFDELVYERGLQNADISRKMKKLNLGRGDQVRADSAESKSIDELKSYGHKIVRAFKGPDSKRFGINKLKQFRLNVTQRSVNLIKEFQSYKWKQDKDENILNEPIDGFDHGIDSIRYAVEIIGARRSSARAKVF